MRRPVSITVMLLALALGAGRAAAELCKECQGKFFIMSIGRCAECGGDASSGAHKLCSACSRKLGQCEHCRTPLAEAPKPAPEDKPAAPEKPAAAEIDLSKPGTHRQGKWEYLYDIKHKGTRSEQRAGRLGYDGRVLGACGLRDRIETPWGTMQYFGTTEPLHSAYNSGWLLKLTYDEPIDNTAGRLLPAPEEVLKTIEAAKRDVKEFRLAVEYHHPQEQDKAFPSLALDVPAIRYKLAANWNAVQIAPEQAVKLIDRLAEGAYFGLFGYADPAARPADVRPSELPSGPRYLLRLHRPHVVEDLGWDRTVPARLESLRQAMDGRPGESMDALLAKIHQLKPDWRPKPQPAPAPDAR